MELSMLTIEAFAHYMRGAVTLFFIIWCFKLYVYKRRNRMMKLLYYATLFLSFSFFKDGVFLFASWKNSMLLNDVARTFDLLFIPLICSFFLEAVRPGLVTNKKLAVALGVQSMFVAIFAVYPDETVISCALIMDFIMSLLTIIYVVIFSIKYRNFISSNYSYRENIDVSWVVISCIVYFSTLFFFTFAFDQTTWLSESMYNLFSIVLWTFLFLYARRHRVMRITYLSDYFNNSLNTTFYDYINTYRIVEACRIIDAMPTEGRKLVKVKGVSPKSYYLSKEIM